jgi:hypothetical protein
MLKLTPIELYFYFYDLELIELEAFTFLHLAVKLVGLTL